MYEKTLSLVPLLSPNAADRIELKLRNGCPLADFQLNIRVQFGSALAGESKTLAGFIDATSVACYQHFHNPKAGSALDVDLRIRNYLKLPFGYVRGVIARQNY
jgi:hypothetical protein